MLPDEFEYKGKPKSKTVMEVLLSKRPDQVNPNKEAFIQCNNLPAFLLTEVTAASHVQRVDDNFIIIN